MSQTFIKRKPDVCALFNNRTNLDTIALQMSLICLITAVERVCPLAVATYTNSQNKSVQANAPLWCSKSLKYTSY